VKCTKCGYLGFETADRCRNCGYEFSLSSDYDLSDVTIQRDQEPVDLDDFALVDAAVAPRSTPSSSGAASAVVTAPRTALRATPSAMPLFAPGIDDDTPLITRPSPPRAPLSVRRSTPDIARLRAIATPKSDNLDLGLDLAAFDAQTAPRIVPSERAIPSETGPAPQLEDAGIGRRVIAAAVDSIILLAIDVVVIYFTMQICGVSIGEFAILPKGPLVAFLVVQNVGYLVAFTAGGQTLGKMLAAIKVVSEDTDVALDLGCALKRTMMWLVLAFPAGLGLLSALFDRDHRGLHDRFAGTRVVRAAA
jgi:uncharacterized RDD family membrane protein YckC